MLRRWFLVLLVAGAAVPVGAAEAPGLDIYFIDVEGGAATLIVTPAGESVLIDCGNPGSRDADRIHQVATQAGLKAIDHLVITHWHVDHYGGVARLALQMPIRNFYDHGIPDMLAEDRKNFPLLIQAYKEASKNRSRTLRPGDEIALRQKEGTPPLTLSCLCGSGEVIPDRPGAPKNPLAAENEPRAEDRTDNARSLGFLLRYGSFRFLDLGDLTWNVEFKLVHPTDKVGPVDVFQVSHHGLNSSNNAVLLKTIRPRVAVFGNGPRKGGHPEVLGNLRRTPDLQAIYQLHRNLTVGAQENTDPEYIANLEEKCNGEPIKLAVAPDGKTYALTVGSKGKTHRYETRLR